jgi:hypothetical protein
MEVHGRVLLGVTGLFGAAIGTSMHTSAARRIASPSIRAIGTPTSGFDCCGLNETIVRFVPYSFASERSERAREVKFVVPTSVGLLKVLLKRE